MSPLPHLFSYIFHFLSNVQFTTTETLAEYMGFNQARSSDGSRVNNQVAINVDRIGVKIVFLSMQWASIRSIINPKLPGNTASFDYYLIEIAVLYCSLGLELALIEENIHVGKRERERERAEQPTTTTSRRLVDVMFQQRSGEKSLVNAS